VPPEESTMKLDINAVIHNHHSDDDLCEVLRRLGNIERKIDAMHAETKQLMTEVFEATNKVAAKIDKLISNAEGGLTKEEAVEHNAELAKLRDSLQAMGADPANPIPTE
jgi:hypothetical protein